MAGTIANANAHLDSGPAPAFDSRCVIQTSLGDTLPPGGGTITSGQLAPQCRALIPAYPSMAQGDAVLLQWFRNDSDDQPVLFARQQIAGEPTGDGYAMAFDIPGAQVWPGSPYPALVTYTVKPAKPTGLMLVSADVLLNVLP